MEDAIAEKRYISFHYRNAGGKESDLTVEPLAIHYKWYAWYLFAYNDEKKQYYTFKVARMKEVEILNRKSMTDHGDIESHMKDGMCRTFIGVPAKERLWKALLLSFGDCVKVAAPEEYKKELINIAEKFLSNYDS